MKIIVLGSGDTRGMPKLGCSCSTCVDAKANGFERKRFGLIVEESGTHVLVDAPPDLRSQFLSLGSSPSDFDALLLTHEHFDHVAGLGEFFYHGKTLPLYGLPSTLQHVFSRHFYEYLTKQTHSATSYPTFALNHTLFFQPFSIGHITVLPLEVEHSTETQGFLFNNKVAVLTDCRPDVPDKTIDAIKNVPLLITDGWLEDTAQFSKLCRDSRPELGEEEFEKQFRSKKLNHMLIPDAKAFGEHVGAKKTIVLHVAHGASPHDELVKKYNTPSFEIGFDGMVVNV